MTRNVSLVRTLRVHVHVCSLHYPTRSWSVRCEPEDAVEVSHKDTHPERGTSCQLAWSLCIR
jgi:hypothetical protein